MYKKNNFAKKIQYAADKAMNVAKEQFDKAGEFFEDKTGPATLAVKLTYKRAEREKLFYEYGKAVYYLEPEETEEIYQKLDALEAEIRQIKADIDSTVFAVDEEKEISQESIYCTKCGAENDEDDGFCKKCGMKLKK